MNELDIARHSRFIDPQLHVWGWEIPVYLFLGGMAAGTLFLSALLWSRPGPRSRAARLLPFIAPALLALGMGALFLDLSHKLHVFRFYLAFRWTSPMSWGAWILLIVFPIAILFGLATIADEDAEALAARVPALRRPVASGRAFALRHARGLRMAAAIAAVGLGGYTGVLLSALGARALWGSALLGPLFLVSGISSGAAFTMLMGVSADERAFLARADVHAMWLEVALILFFLVGLATGGGASRAAADLVLGGPYTAPFWALVVAAGLVVPSAMELLERRLHLAATAVAPALVLVGGFALRWILVAAGQS
ncbi:MAG TPA: NrfD/PsrC family molybdoenzyme membrane anchor subunit [Anaeromyxobacter sp.]